MNAEILTVGTELLLGDILNSNSQFLSRELAAYGVDILYQSTVGDNAQRLKGTLETALSRSNVVIITGGLGPTEDDLTRETVAEYFRLPLVLHEESLTRIQEYFQNTGREYSENNRKQAMLPEGCVVFPNDHGTAPGCAVERYGQTVILLPGPPREMMPMFTEYVAPYLSGLAGGTIHSHTVGVFGIPEATVGERLQDLMKGENPTVAPYAKDGEVLLRVTAKAPSVEEADALCMPIIQEIRDRLGVAVYGVDTGSLQKTVVGLLKEKNIKIATAESCTAGMLSGRLTEVPGVSEVFECGVAAYSKEIKHQVLGVPEHVLKNHGAVSSETAAAMAMGVRKVGDANIGIGITGVAGPDPSEEKAVGTVYVALADEHRVWVKKIFAGHGAGDREAVRTAATTHALDMTRRYLEALPAVMAGGQRIHTLYETEDTAVMAGKKSLSARAKKTLWITALVIVLVAALLLTYVNVLTPYINQKKYEELQALYAQGVPEGDDSATVYPEGIQKQFMSLYRTNADVRGWLSIAGTTIKYPVVQEPRDHYYDERDFYRQPSAYGIPHVDAEVEFGADKENRSLVIFGNNTADGQMFTPLTEYAGLAFLKANPLIEMNTLYRNDTYKVFAVMIVGEEERYTDNFDYTVDTFESEEDFLHYVSEIRRRSLFDTPVTVEENDALLMLTTPIDYGFDGARIVVAARRVREGETTENNLSRARRNANVLMPLAWQIQQGDITVATVSGSSTTTVTESTTTATATSTTQTEITNTTTIVSDPSETTATEYTVSTAPNDQNQEGDELLGESEPTTTAGTTAETAPTTVTTTVATTTKTTATTVPTTAKSTTQISTTVTGTATTVLATETTQATEGSQTTVTAQISTTVTEETTGSTTVSAAKPTTAAPVEGLVSGTINESEFLKYFVVRNLNAASVKLPGQGENGMIRPTTKEQLQYVVASIVKSELGSASTMVNSTEAQKAQAVASYNYAMFYNYYYKTAYNVACKPIDLNDKWDKKIFDAVGEVLGVKLLDTQKSNAGAMLCQTFYFAATGGYTASSNKVWTGLLPFAVSVESPHDNELTYTKYGGKSFASSVTLTREAFKTRVTNWFKNNVQNRYPTYVMPEEQFEGDTLLTATSYDGNGTAGEGDLWNCVYFTNLYYQRPDGSKAYLTGHNLRNALGLRSHAFRAEYDAKADKLVIRVQGYGHGVGLSQMGAVGYANEDGWSYIQILKHYYSVTETSNHQLVAPKWDIE